jgi:hypothetical protein
MISVSSCISVMGRLDMVHMELTCQNLIRLTMWLEEQPQELEGPLPSFLGIPCRCGATWLVHYASNQQEWVNILGASTTSRHWTLEELYQNSMWNWQLLLQRENGNSWGEIEADGGRRCVRREWYTIDTKVFCRLLMTSKKVVKSVTEQHNGQMCIAGGAWGIWEQTFIDSSRTKNLQNCSSPYVRPIRRNGKIRWSDKKHQKR